MNLELSAERWGVLRCFTANRALVLRSFFRNEEASARQLADGILRYVKLVQELRAGPVRVTKPLST